MSAAPPLSRTVTLSTPQGSLVTTVELGPGPARLVDLATVMQGLVDDVYQRACEHAARAGRRCTCGPSCGACCRQVVPVSLPEALRVADALEWLDPVRRSVARRRFRAVLDGLGTASLRRLEGELSRPVVAAPRLAREARSYLAAAQSCPLLGREQSCGIHPQRPLICREYGVTTPASWCAEPWAQPVVPLLPPSGASAVLARVVADLTGRRPRLRVLPNALAWSTQHAELAARTWPAAELLERLTAQLHTRPG